MDLCNEKCYANCDLCQYAILEDTPIDKELLIQDRDVVGCKLGDSYYQSACNRKEGLFCDRFKCVMLAHDEYARTHIHISIGEYIKRATIRYLEY